MAKEMETFTTIGTVLLLVCYGIFFASSKTVLHNVENV